VESRVERKKRLKGRVYRLWSSSFGRCLAPGGSCTRTPIHVHSVQRQGAMRLLSDHGHVVMLRQRLDLDGGPRVSFESGGVKKATVFTGLCAEHDFSLFERIDRDCLCPEDMECLFLHAYRAILRETHVCLDVAVKLQLAYQEQCDLDLVDRNVPSRGGLYAVERMTTAFETFLYKEHIDEAFLTAC
jgi:hypothetical protein